MGRALAVAAAVLALAAPALASAAKPRLPSPLPPEPRLSKAEATRIFLSDDKVSDWLGRYPHKDRTTEATYKHGAGTIKIWWGAAAEIATGKIDDRSGAGLEAWPGPPVAWKSARGRPRAFAGYGDTARRGRSACC